MQFQWNLPVHSMHSAAIITIFHQKLPETMMHGPILSRDALRRGISYPMMYQANTTHDALDT